MNLAIRPFHRRTKQNTSHSACQDPFLYSRESSAEPLLLRSRTQLMNVIHVCDISSGYFIKELVEAEFPDVKLQPSFTKVESFKDSSGLAPVESDNSAFLLPGVHGRG